ncbi:MAG: class I SAM-dependent methyltransferase [Gammaproteobacteria bacterium]|nr:class I SAM-dependent methyltransferase [Gammaproteobacteria bacterium]
MNTTSKQEEWEARYRLAGPPSAPCKALADNLHLLPKHGGQALDLACGPGANALLLAEQGLEVHAWDFAANAIAGLREIAQAKNLPIHTEVRDVLKYPPPADTFDVIVVSRFLERNLAQALQQALKPNGLLFYQTFTKADINASGPKNPAFRLAENELLRLFQNLLLLVYREEGLTGDTNRGFRGEAFLVAKKR